MNFINCSINYYNGTPFWLVLPFCIWLFMIATGPVLYAKFWHSYYARFAVFFACIVLGYYFVLGDYGKLWHFAAEYIQFIALISSLYIVSNSVHISVNSAPSPWINVGFLFFGGVLANLIGTTGASMLLIRPYIRFNRDRINVYHIVFFIFIVSNVGGALTPIGDPPLFIGFLNGIPFFWTLFNNFLPWCVALFMLLGVFFFIDSNYFVGQVGGNFSISVRGSKNIWWLAVIIGSVFLDPVMFSWVPALNINGHSYSFLRELIMIASSVVTYFTCDRDILVENDFSFEPLREVVFLFIGIFSTMIPALGFVSAFSSSSFGEGTIGPKALFWGTGILSSFLDNAPTYLTSLTASMSTYELSINNVLDVANYSKGVLGSSTSLCLRAISVSSVFFGAMTYIGNGPNFMVRSIAESSGIKMPSFFKYIIGYSVTILLPILVTVYLIFF